MGQIVSLATFGKKLFAYRVPVSDKIWISSRERAAKSGSGKQKFISESLNAYETHRNRIARGFEKTAWRLRKAIGMNGNVRIYDRALSAGRLAWVTT